MVIDSGSRSGASFADSIAIPVTQVTPTPGVTTKPAGLASLAKSRFRYLAGVPSIALATPSEPGLFAEEAMIASLGWRTFFCAWAVPAKVAHIRNATAGQLRPIFLNNVSFIG